MYKKVLILLCLAAILFSCSSKRGNVLYIFNWTDYIAEDLINKFEKENNCKVVYDTYNSNENMLTKMLNTKSSYDLVVPSGDHVAIMLQKDMLEPLDKSKLTNYKNLDPAILEQARNFDPENKYSVPYFWGTTGLIYNRKFISASVLQSGSWNIIADPFFKNKNKITLLDDAREVVGAALIYKGYNPNDTSDEALKAAKEVLNVWDSNVSQYDSDSYKNEIQDGTTWLAQAYNGDALQIMINNPDVNFLLPKEGASLWIDNIVIPKSAEHKELAYKFIDFMLDAENGKINAEYVQYATPNQASLELLSEQIRNNEMVYPKADYIAKCHMINNIGEEVLKIDAIWQEIRK
ncbi:MAG TPA: spermidine/putrescine ABC transporter substrate-binding protein [Candidatus Cloacimonadota bacterium]|nr:spermidine/putrescine ABC transporter substrate-binding protein [Candidatus Cloacimonadota bacterium]